MNDLREGRRGGCDVGGAPLIASEDDRKLLLRLIPLLSGALTAPLGVVVVCIRWGNLPVRSLETNRAITQVEAVFQRTAFSSVGDAFNVAPPLALFCSPSLKESAIQEPTPNAPNGVAHLKTAH